MTHTTLPGFRNRQYIKKKGKRVALTVENKLEVCKMVNNNVLKSFIMEKFSVGRSTLYDILKSEKMFKAEKEELGLIKVTKTNKKVEGSWFEKLDNALYIWLCQEREKDSPITGPILLEKASKLYRLIYTI